jgi:hypothetical protein
MKLPRRKFTARARNARLDLELLESRLAPAVVNVNAAANVHPIDRNVYGTAYASTAQLLDLRVPLNRNGGNAADTYSYAQDSTNRGSDWFFESIRWGSATGNGEGMDAWINETRAGGAQPSTTLNLFDWGAKNAASSSLGSFPVSTYGAQQSVDPWNTNLGNGVRANGTNITGNDPNIAYVPNSPAVEQAWIQHLISTFGNSQNGGVQYYTLGNEPGLWHHTHRDIHPAGVTHTELRDRVIAYASMVKSLDPNAKILGFEEWGWTNYFVSGADSAASNWGATYNGLNFQTWLLDQIRQHNTTTGQRLLDYFTLHFYPQGGQFSDNLTDSMQLLRNRSTRSLWDPNYVDESWIASTGINGGRVNLINMMENWVNTYYPGTKTGITEYNWGAEGHMNGATTQADIWGIFGREGLDLANRWTTPATGSPTYLAMKMYRNYDGSGGEFGDTSVGATVANPDEVSAFASIRDDGALTVMVVNKNLFNSGNPTATTSITLNLSNFAAGGAAQRWQLAATNPSNQTVASITQLSNVAVTGNSLTVTVPMQSVTLFVIPAATAPQPPAAPSNLGASAVSQTQINLTWSDNAANETGYVVERATDSNFTTGLTTVNLGANAISYSATGLAPSTTYWFRVRATNAEGPSANSNVASATTHSPPAPDVGTGLAATYFNNANFTGATISRVDPIVNFNWGTGAPAAGIAADTFSVRWLGQVKAVESGNYRFRTISDEGVRLWVNGQLVINNWTAHTATTNTSAAVALVAGQKYDIRLQFFENTGAATMRLLWQRPGQTAYTVIPQGQLFVPGDGLRATYFDNSDFTGTSVSRIDGTVNFDWGAGSPVAAIGPDTFSARWAGRVQAVESGTYTFRTNSDDGVRVWVNGQLVINNWTDHAPTYNTGTIALQAGQKYDIVVEYYENTGGAVLQLEWQRPGQTAFAVIPQGNLFSA